jgi:nitrite reductase/ring-hydroxylating ferredoxin subunit
MTVDDECQACPLSEVAVERREFLRDAVARSLAAMGALSMMAGAAGAMPVAFVSGLGARAAKRYPVPAGDGVAIDKDESVIIARFQDRAYAFSLACPHQNTALRWEAKDRRFQCPKHKSRYQPDGVFIEGRATRGLDRFAVTLDGDALVVDLDRLYREDKHAAQWKDAFVTLPPREK